MLFYIPCWLDYPWRTAVQPLTSNVIKWFYLPDFAMRPNPLFIFCESTFLCFSSLLTLKHLFFSVIPCVRSSISLLLSADDHLLLLCSSLQWQVFEEENRAAVRLLAGDNVEISRSLDPCSFNQFIPVNNFLHCRSEMQTLFFRSFYLFFSPFTFYFRYVFFKLRLDFFINQTAFCSVG